LKAGEARSVKIAVKLKDLAWWNGKTHRWQINKGNYLLQVGSSSADIKQQTEIQCLFKEYLN
jgi:beta-glucosidase